MTDVALKKPLKIEIPFENAWPRVRLSVDQVEPLKKLLDSRGIRYWVSEFATSFNNSPYETELHFYRDSDPKKVQELLDAVN